MRRLFVFLICLSAFLFAKGQTFTSQTGANNPLNGVDVGTESTTAFGDLDGDGDYDFISGEGNGNFNYFENTGTVTVPAFTQRTGGANPFNGFDVGTRSTPSIIDIDGDGDLDMMAGEFNGNFNYFENTGTSLSPTYVQRTGALNPMNGEDVGRLSSPKFADIDDDGDYDIMTGEYDGEFFYFENTGSAAAPAFTERTGASNPMNGVNLSFTSRPGFVDVDSDGDWDLFAGEYNPGRVNYFENTGSASAPVYTQRTGAANPMNGINVGTNGRASPAYIDLDNDGNSDAMIGESNGTFNYFTGNNIGGTPLPIELIYFDATILRSQTNLSWATASEENFDYFEIKRAIGSTDFKHIGELPGPGEDVETIQEYWFIDEKPLNGINYYRLKSIDLDGSFEYSDIQAVKHSFDSRFEIYPNPSDGTSLNILMDEVEEGYRIIVYDNMGLQVYESLIKGHDEAYALPNLKSGVYTIKLLGRGDNLVQKLVVY